MEDALIINNVIIQEHPLWCSCSESLSGISDRDYPSEQYFKDFHHVDALDLDGYEKSLKKGNGNTECTGDAVIGISLDWNNGVLSKSAYLLVELRMNYKHGDNISISCLDKKVQHSKDLLIGSKYRIHPYYYFVFTTKVAQQAKRYLYEEVQEIGRNSTYCAISVDDLKKLLIDPATLPYVPKYSKDAILQSIIPLLQLKTVPWEQVLKELNYWNSLILNTYFAYERKESKHIFTCLKELIDQIEDSLLYSTMSTDEELSYEIFKEEYENCRNLLCI